MNRALIAVALCVGLGLAVCAAAENSASAPSTAAAATTSSTAAASSANTVEVVDAAEAFLTTLSDTQRQSVVLDFNDPARTAGWSNLPNIVFPRSGVALGDLDDTQLRAALAVLEAVLSDDGFQEVQQVMLSDDYLGRVGTAQGAPPAAVHGSGYYNVAFYGQPTEQSPFAVHLVVTTSRTTSSTRTETSA